MESPVAQDTSLAVKPIFGGFSAESISGRILDCKSEFVITADEGVRGGKNIPLKNITDKALSVMFFRGIFLPPLTPSSAVITNSDLQSNILPDIDSAENPPKIGFTANEVS